jgi:hypothetical protein
MVMIVQGGPDVFADVAFGPNHPSTLQFLQQQVFNMSDTLTAAGREFMNRGQELFEKYNGHKAIQMAKAALRASQYMFQQDIIQPLYTLGAIQQAQPLMQRWIMACPDVREMYHMQRCDGYSTSYVDMQPGCIGEAHYDYRKVMNGIVQDGSDEDEFDWKCTTYVTDLDEDDMDLTLTEKSDILSLWDLVKTMMKPGKEDPTSPYCDTL